MSTRELRKAAHGVFEIHLHIVFVSKYRRKVFTELMLNSMGEVFKRVLEANRCQLEEFKGEPDHVHLLINLHPDNNVSDLMGSLKSASSRVLRKEFAEEIRKFYWGDAKLWHDGKCVISVGGAPISIIETYIQNQSGGRPDSVGEAPTRKPLLHPQL
jgi:putative transposase